MASRPLTLLLLAQLVLVACIDAPELAQSPWGQQARSYLQQRLPIGRELTLDIKSPTATAARLRR